MSNPQYWTRAFLSAIVALFLSASASAQYRAALQGTVTDATGNVIPGANVTLTSRETAVARTTTTTDSGVYTISSLAPGHYKLTVEKTGFSQKTLDDVLVSAEQAQSVNVQLEVGATTETVTVSANAAPLLDTETATIGGTITTQEVHNLPSFARDPYQLLRLAPGTFGDDAVGAGGSGTQLPGTNKNGPSSTDSIFQVENGPGVVANGSRQNANNFQLDGLSVNSTVWGGSAVVTPNEESVKEIRVVSNNYSAENGRTSGAQVEVVSQNGTNDLHGSFFFKWHRPELNAYQRWNGPGTPSPVLRDNADFNQFGGSLGGPLWKNKLFAFFSYETLRNSSSSIQTNWFETPQFDATAAASGSIASQFLSWPGTGAVVTRQITQTCADVGLPSTQCHDVSGGLDLGSPLKAPLGTPDPTYGKPGTPYGIGNGFDGVPDAMYVQTTFPNTVTDVQYNGRVDYVPSSKDQIVYSMYWVPVETHSFNGPPRVANKWNHASNAFAISGIYTHTFSPSVLNEARFGVSGWNWNEQTSNPQLAFGFPTASINGAGSIGFQQFGPPGFSIFDQKTYNARDTLTKVHGSHFMKFGGDYSRALMLDAAPWAGRPNYDFHNLWDFANDAPYHENGNFDPVTGQPTSAIKNLRFNILAFFVQDDWKVRPNLTVNLGMRWEYFSPLTETHGNISKVILGSGADALAGLQIKKGGELYQTSKNNWGPQIGFSWSPKAIFGRDFENKFVVRGGFGIGYNLAQLAITSNGRFNPPFLTAFDLFGSDILYALNSNLHSFTGYPSNPATILNFGPNGLPTTGAPVDLTGFPLHQPTPVTYRYSLDTQYAISTNWMASIGYQGSQSRHLTIQDNLVYLLYPESNPRVHSLSWYGDDANSSFNALLTELQHRFSQTFELDAQYRFSRNTDNGSQDYFTSNYPWNRKFAYGPADFDVTHNFKLYGVWSPRIFRGHNWLERLAGGWTFSGIWNLHSGFPWTPQYCNTNGNVLFPNSGFGCLFPASYKGGAGSNFSNSTFERQNGNFPNGALAYLTVPTWPTNGIPPAPSDNIHRNMFRGPRYNSTDMVFAKDFGLPRMGFLGENARVRVQASAYNLFNNLNLTSPNGTISNDGVTSNPQFGQSQGAFSGRIIEFQARFSF